MAAPDDQIAAVNRHRQARASSVHRPVMLCPTRIVGGGVDRQQGRQYDVAPDGRFLINMELDSADAPITLIQNWQPREN